MLSEAFRKLSRRSEPDVQAMRERFAAHVAGHDAVEFDGTTGNAEYKSRGRTIWRARAMLLAKLNADLHLFGWWWHGLATWTGSGPLDEIVRAGDRESVAEFHTDALSVSDDDEAFALAELAGAISEAHGVSFTRTGAELTFWALFDVPEASRAPSSRPPARATPTSPQRSVRPPPPSFPPEEGAGRYSITEPPPAMTSSSSRPPLPPRPAAGSIPPRPSAAPRGSRMPELPVGSPVPTSVRPHEAAVRPVAPTREAFSKITDLAMEAARAAQPEGVRQVLVVASVDPQGGGRRLAVHLVALAHSGKMVSIDVPRELVNAITKMAADAAQAGTPRWKRLVARIADDERGFSFEIEMR